MRLLATGSSGYLASLVLPRLAADPGVEAIVGLDVRPPAAAAPGFRHVPGSVLDPGLDALFRGERIDTLLHLAWVFNPSHDAAETRRIDVEGTRNVLEAAAAAGVRDVVYLSSTTAYGAHPDNPPALRETDPVRGSPGFPYSADKAAVEAWLGEFRARHPKVCLTVLRPTIVLGRRTDNFVRAILDLPILLRIAGQDPELQFLHEDDLADCLTLIVRRRPGGVFNLAPRETVRMSELGPLTGRAMIPLPAALAGALVGLLWRLRLFPAPAPYLDFVRWRWVADPTRIEEDLGLRPRHGSRSAVLATLERRRTP